MTEKALFPTVMSLDGEGRIADFFSRHGGPGRIGEQEGDEKSQTSGWSEVYAADGHRLRCEWTRAGNNTHMNFSEIPPAFAGESAGHVGTRINRSGTCT